MLVRQFLPLASLLLLPACATMTSGRQQIVTITTTPAGAACVVDRMDAPPGDHMVQIAHTPDSVLIDRSASALKITCASQGYPVIQVAQRPGIEPYAGFNVLNGVVIGVAVDEASGALFQYPDQVHIDLAPRPAPAAVYHRPVPAAYSAPALPAPGAAAPRTAVRPTPLAPPPDLTRPASPAPGVKAAPPG